MHKKLSERLPDGSLLDLETGRVFPPLPAPSGAHRCGDHKCDECYPPRSCASCGQEISGTDIAHSECWDSLRARLDADMERFLPHLRRRQ